MVDEVSVWWDQNHGTMNTMDYVLTVLAMASCAWYGYMIGTLKVWPGPAVKLPLVKREPKPGEIWVMIRETHEGPWDVMLRVEIMGTLDGLVEVQTLGTYYQACIRKTIVDSAEVFEPADEQKEKR